jgi:hypothetical protein
MVAAFRRSQAPSVRIAHHVHAPPQSLIGEPFLAGRRLKRAATILAVSGLEQRIPHRIRTAGPRPTCEGSGAEPGGRDGG